MALADEDRAKLLDTNRPATAKLAAHQSMTRQDALLPKILPLQHGVVAAVKEVIFRIGVGIGSEPGHNLVSVQSLKAVAMLDPLLMISHTQHRRLGQGMQRAS
jgi:hypothetical protein